MVTDETGVTNECLPRMEELMGRTAQMSRLKQTEVAGVLEVADSFPSPSVTFAHGYADFKF